jgi:hypothetical protein
LLGQGAGDEHNDEKRRPMDHIRLEKKRGRKTEKHNKRIKKEKHKNK